MEASTIPATAALAPGTTTGRRVAAGPLLRLRSDEQLVRLFRAGSDDAFRVIHDRYRTRLFAYARQMLGGSRADAEDALQDVFVRAYGALRANDREVSLRAWLYRIAHNRCIDELRRPASAPGADAEVLELVQAPASDPLDALERRESLRRLVADVQRLPEQQRSALLMREISGMAYQDLATALDVTVPAVKSLLVRARIGLAQAAEARDTACAAIRADLADAHERGVRASGLVKRHLHDCTGCSAYRKELRALDTRLAALVPALGPVALVAKLLGIGGGSAGVAGGGATAAGGAGATAAAAGGGAAAAAGAGAAGVSLSHVAAAVAVAVVSAGGAVEVQHKLLPDDRPRAAIVRAIAAPAAPAAPVLQSAGGSVEALLPDAALRPELAEQPLTPAADEEVLAEPSTPTLDADGTGNGGAAAPAEPPADTLDPLAPPSDDTVVEDNEGTVATSGSSTTTPPASGDDTTAPEAPPSEPAPAPADTTVATTSAVPPTAAPTSTTTGGATYRPR